MNELEIPFGRTPQGRLVRPDDVPRGEACNCSCPACGKPLLSRQGAIRRWHFAHTSDAACSTGQETAIHLMAKQVIADAKYLDTPEILLGSSRLRPPTRIPVSNPQTEPSWHGFRPDILLDGPLAIEVTVTHPSDPTKIAAYQHHDIPALEIKLSLQTPLFPPAFRQTVLSSAPRSWLHHPLPAQEAKRRAHAAAQADAERRHLANLRAEQQRRATYQAQLIANQKLEQHDTADAHIHISNLNHARRSAIADRAQQISYQAQLLDRPPGSAPHNRTCFHCSATTAFFGYGPPGWIPTIYACQTHRSLAETRRRP